MRFINPDQTFTDNTTGQALSLGTVYFGQPNQDPKTDPKAPYSDLQLTTEISPTQELTSAGKFTQGVYLKGLYSVIAEDSEGNQIFSELVVAGIGAGQSESYPLSTMSDLLDSSGLSGTTDRIYIESYYPVTYPSTTGPIGGHYRHRTALTGTPGTVSGDMAYDQDGVGWQWDGDIVDIREFGATPILDPSPSGLAAANDSAAIIEYCIELAEDTLRACRIDGMYRVDRAVSITAKDLIAATGYEKLRIIGNTVLVGAGDHDVVDLGRSVNIESLTVFTPNIATPLTYAGVTTGTSIDGYRNKIGMLKISQGWGGTNYAMGIAGQYFFSNEIGTLLLEGLNCPIRVPLDRDQPGEFNANHFGSMEIYVCKKNMGWIGQAKACTWGTLVIQDCNNTEEATEADKGILAFTGIPRGCSISSLYLEQNAAPSLRYGHPDESPADTSTAGLYFGLTIENLYHSNDTATTVPAVRVRRSGLRIRSAEIINISGDWIVVEEEDAAGEIDYWETQGASNATLGFFDSDDQKFRDYTSRAIINQEWPNPVRGYNVLTAQTPAGANFANYTYRQGCEWLDVRAVANENGAGTPRTASLIAMVCVDADRVIEVSRVDDGSYSIDVVHDSANGRIQVKAGAGMLNTMDIRLYINEQVKKIGRR